MYVCLLSAMNEIESVGSAHGGNRERDDPRDIEFAHVTTVGRAGRPMNLLTPRSHVRPRAETIDEIREKPTTIGSPYGKISC